jgi:hypothetical protein
METLGDLMAAVLDLLLVAQANEQSTLMTKL